MHVVWRAVERGEDEGAVSTATVGLLIGRAVVPLIGSENVAARGSCHDWCLCPL